MMMMATTMMIIMMQISSFLVFWASSFLQVLLFSATMPREVQETSAKFMAKDRVLINTVGTANKTAEGFGINPSP